MWVKILRSLTTVEFDPHHGYPIKISHCGSKSHATVLPKIALECSVSGTFELNNPCC